MILSFDVETDGLDATGTKYLTGCVLTEDGKHAFFDKPQTLWRHILNIANKQAKLGRNTYAYAHNAAYDFWNVYDRHDTNIRFHNSQPFMASYPIGKRRLWILDSMNLFAMSLAKLGNTIGLPKLDAPFIFGNSHKPTEQELKKLEPYCLRDCEIVLQAILKLRYELDSQGIHTKRLLTRSQVAISYFMQEFRTRKCEYILLPDTKSTQKDGLTNMIKWPDNPRMIHHAYKGGRCDAFHTGTFENVTYLDCNNLYGFVATQMVFPNLHTERRIKKPLQYMDIDTLLSHPGVSLALVENISCIPGCLAVKVMADETENRYFPGTGTYIIGTWTHSELDYARKHGNRIHYIHSSIIWDTARENPYKGIIPHIYELRNRPDNGWSKYLYKSFMNLHIGKMAYNKPTQEIVLANLEDGIQLKEQGYEVLRSLGYYLLFKKPTKEGDNFKKRYYNPIIPCLITAEARIYMHRQYARFHPGNLHYTDTDSLIFSGDIPTCIPVGNDIGQFKMVNQNVPCIIWGRKTKAVGDDISISGIHSSHITIDEFRHGIVTTTNMLGLSNRTELNSIGQFVTSTRNLAEITETLDRKNAELADQQLFIDFYDDDSIDMNAFTDILRSLERKVYI